MQVLRIILIFNCIKRTVKMFRCKAVFNFCHLAFAGGETDNRGSRDVVLDVLAYGDNANEEGLGWVRIVETFMDENPDITIQYEILFEQPYHEKVKARLAAGEVPDIAYMGTDAKWGQSWKEADVQFDHRPYIDSDYFNADQISRGPNGEIFVIPMGSTNTTTVLFANKVLIKKSGFELPQTYEDIKKMVPAAKAKGIEVISFGGAAAWVLGSCMMSTFVARFTGDAHFI